LKIVKCQKDSKKVSVQKNLKMLYNLRIKFARISAPAPQLQVIVVIDHQQLFFIFLKKIMHY